ncbi:MAG: hypothetical protein IKT40_00055 [Bacilli bacterium]|nr:hypothetical protein [Bacilli bacterium]
MENKPQNVFEKLDKQGEQIEDISSKLEGISINDLYALAKRTWDYGDFQTAQKYYNHISLLKPLDWEAPLYASLCNFKGYHNMFFWTKVPEQVEKIIVSTIKYINNLELDSDKKEKEMSKCVEIIKDEMLKTKEHYFKYKKEYDDADSDYIYILQEYFINVYNDIKDIELKAIKDFNIVVAENCLSLIELTEKLSSRISKDLYQELISISSKSFDINFDKLVEENKAIGKPKNDLSLEEIKEIKLKGKMYFEFNDKVISKRHFRNKIIFSSMLILLSLAGIVSSFLSKTGLSLIYILPLLYGLYLISAGFTQKERIKCNSLFSPSREYNRLTSDGNIVIEKKVNIIIIVFGIGSVAFIGLGIHFFNSIFNYEELDLTLRIILMISMVLDAVVYYLAYLKFSNEYHSKFNGTYSYLYKDKYYKFDR